MKIRNILFVLMLLFVLVEAQVVSENIVSNMTLFTINEFSQQDNFANGFVESVSGQNIHYHSALPTVNDALITRATDGKMEISWRAASPEDSENVTYFWLAGMGRNIGFVNFDLLLNGQKLATFSTRKAGFEQVEISGVKLKYRVTFMDAVDDNFGVMAVSFPKGYLQPAQDMIFSVIGHKENSAAWYMIFKSSDFYDKALQTAHSGSWYRISKNIRDFTLALPLNFLTTSVSINGQSINLQDGKCCAIGSFSNVAFPITITVDGKVYDKVENDDANLMHVFSDGRVKLRSINKTRERIDFTESQFIDLAKDINHLQNSRFKNANIHLISSSHQDIAWMDDPATCKIQRDTMIIAPAMQLLEDNKDYHYSAEQALMLREYLDRNPNSLDNVRKFTLENRLEWGASFNQPYEGLWRGESLMRQFYLGRKWLKKMIPGYDPKVYFNVDVPGRTIQMPQIAKKCGVEYMIISRHEKSFFWWASPDGSKLAVHSPGHYHGASEFLRSSPSTVISQAPKAIMSYEDIYDQAKLPNDIPILFSSDMLTPKNFDDFFHSWKNIVIDDKGTNLPAWKYNTFQSAIEPIFAKGKNISTIAGERPNVWLYIHGPTHHRLVSASREGGRLLPVAESFSAIEALLKNDFGNYPQAELTKAWENHIFPDHGLGGQDGYITDQLFKAKSEKALEAARSIIKEKVQEISKYINVDDASNIILYNATSMDKHDVARVQIKLKQGQFYSPQIFDADDAKMNTTTQVLSKYKDGTIKEVEFTFIADVPSLGYATFYIKNDNEKAVAHDNSTSLFENKFYKIEFVDGGIKQIFDKVLNSNLFETSGFLGFEVIGLSSVGNGAGEFDQVQQATTEWFERSSQYKSSWSKVADNSVFTKYRLKTRLENSVLEQFVTIYNDIKKIDFDASVLNWDNEKYREYRIAFPIKNKNSKVTFEVPFAKVTAGQDEIPGAAGERYLQPAKDLHPREVLDWISANNQDFGVTFSSSVAVWDYEDVTGIDNHSRLLQPILLASRKSCHSNGNWFLQPGDHHFKFSMTSHKTGWQNGYLSAKSSNNPFIISSAVKTSAARLPEKYSFLSLSAENVLLSTLKKAEESNDLVLRVFNMSKTEQSLAVRLMGKKTLLQSVNGIEEPVNIKPVSKVLVGGNSIETYGVTKLK